jgi:hypothetical protein
MKLIEAAQALRAHCASNAAFTATMIAVDGIGRAGRPHSTAAIGQAVPAAGIAARSLAISRSLASTMRPRPRSVAGSRRKRHTPLCGACQAYSWASR